MQAGKLRHRINLQKKVTGRNPETGGISEEWQSVTTVWASIEPLSAREFIAAGATQASITPRITIRYRDGVTAQMRAVSRGKIYNIEGVLPDAKSGREYLTLPCSEGVNDG